MKTWRIQIWLALEKQTEIKASLSFPDEAESSIVNP